MRLPEQLPPLRGATFAIYRVLGAALIVLTVLGATVGSNRLGLDAERRALAFYHSGLIGMPSSSDIRVGAFSEQTKAAGLTTGTLEAIDGHDVRGQSWHSRTNDFLRWLPGREGSIVTVVVRADQGPRLTLRLTRSAAYLRQAYAGTGITFEGRQRATRLLNAIGGLAMALLMALFYARRPRDPVSAMIVLGRGVIKSLTLAAAFGLDYNWVSAADMLGQMLFLTGIMLFPAARLRPLWQLAALAAMAVLVAADGLATDGPPWLHDSFLPLSYALAAVTVIAHFRRTPPGIERQQTKWAGLGIAGLALCTAAQTAIDFLIPNATNEGVRAWEIVAEALVGGIAPLLLCSALLVAVLRYRLYDADAAISRSAAYGALTLALLAVFAGSEKVIEVAGERWFGEEAGALAAGLAAGIAAVLIAPLHHRVSHWAEQRFQQALLHLRHGVPLLVGDLRETASAEEIAAAVLRRCETGVRATGGAVILGGDLLRTDGVVESEAAAWLAAWRPPAGDKLDSDPADPLFPVRVPLVADGVGTVGWLLLGPRPDGSLYGKDERAALAEIADPLARALAIARARAAAAAERRAEAQALSTRVTKLEMMVTRLTGATPGLAAG